MRNLHLLVCLVLSGFAGLAYELLWVRLLALSFGSTTLSFSTVLAVFFGGLALGAWLSGRRAHRLSRPVRVYAFLEIGTGLLALALYPLLVHAGALFAYIDPGPGLMGAGLRAAVAGPLLLGPTLLMGATLPAVVRAVVVDDGAVASGSALIYGFNTLGACLGAYLVTYALLPQLGVFLATVATVLVNLIAAGVALLLEDRRPREPRDEPSEDVDVPEKIRWVVTALAFAVGFSAICFQVAWVRLFSIFLDGTVYAVGSVLVAVLVGIGLGSLLVARPLRSSRFPAAWLAALQLVTLVSLVGLSIGLPWIAYTLRSIPYASPGLSGLHLQLLVVLVALIVPTSSSGASFPVLMAIVERRASRAGRSLGGLYAANTLGSIAGSLVGGFILLPLAGSVATVFVGLLFTALVGALAAGLLAERESPILRAGLALAPLLIVASWNGFDVQTLSLGGRGSAVGRSYPEFRRHLEQRKATVKFFAEGQGATVVVWDRKGTRSLALNGLGQGARKPLPPHPIYESLMVAAVPLAHHPAPERVLVVGLGAGSTLDALVALGVEDIEVVELESSVVEALEHVFPPERSPLENPRVRVVLGDARHHLAKHRARGGKPFDVITSMPAHPWVASTIFTREFFRLARDNLADNGVFSTWFGLGRMDQVALDGLVRAFAEVFDSFVIYHLEEAAALYLVGKKGPISVDVERFGTLRAHPMLKNTRRIDDDLHLARRVVASGLPEDPAPTPGPVNTDDSALVEIRSPRTATAARGLNGVLPREALAAALIEPRARRSEIARDVLESHLGTPDGESTLVSRRAEPARVRRNMKALAEALDSRALQYFEGRLALAEGKERRAEEKLRGVEGPLRSRARAFLSYTRPRGPERAKALAALPGSGPIWLARLREGDPSVADSLPADAPDFASDRWGWLVWHALTPTATVGNEGRTHFGDLGPELVRSKHLEALELGHRLAERSGWAIERAILTGARAGARRARAQAELRRGRTAGSKGDFRTAREALSLALELGAPLDTWRLYLVALVETGASPSELSAARSRMRFAGYTHPAIDVLLDRARAGRGRDDAP